MENQPFAWGSVGDLTTGRPNLGPKVGVAMYRMMQYTMRDTLRTRFGEEAARELFRSAGAEAGGAYCRQFLDVTLPFDLFIAQLARQLEDDLVGILRIESADLARLKFTLTVSEDLDCSGLPVNGATVCDYDEGFIGGILKTYTGKDFEVREVDCWATGDRTCRFKAQPVEAK